MMQMAQQMMSDPNMMKSMQDMMSGRGTPDPATMMKMQQMMAVWIQILWQICSRQPRQWEEEEWVGWAVEWAVLGALRKTLMMMTMTMMMMMTCQNWRTLELRTHFPMSAVKQKYIFMHIMIKVLPAAACYCCYVG
ncbi:unnamed protein product [Heterosigma akashiwo]